MDGNQRLFCSAVSDGNRANIYLVRLARYTRTDYLTLVMSCGKLPKLLQRIFLINRFSAMQSYADWNSIQLSKRLTNMNSGVAVGTIILLRYLVANLQVIDEITRLR